MCGEMPRELKVTFFSYLELGPGNVHIIYQLLKSQPFSLTKMNKNDYNIFSFGTNLITFTTKESYCFIIVLLLRNVYAEFKYLI